MTGAFDDERGRGWDLLGRWQELARPFTDLAAEDAWPLWGSQAALQTLLEAVKSRLIGREIEVGKGKDRIRLTLSSIDTHLSPVSTAAGQADELTLAAEHLIWRSIHLPHVSATLRNVHTRVGARPALVCAPVEVYARITGEGLTMLLEKRMPKVRLEVSDTGRVFARLTRHPKWGAVELTPAVEGGCVLVRPAGIARGKRIWHFRRSLPSARLRLTLPDAARIITVDGCAGHLAVQLRVDEWRLDYVDMLSMAKRSS